jgi:putative transposase
MQRGENGARNGYGPEHGRSSRNKRVASPTHLNAFAERFVLSVRSECLSRMVPLGEAHFRRAIAEFVQHYHHQRNHQGLDNALIVPGEVMDSIGKAVRRDRLGGLLGFYYREAA